MWFPVPNSESISSMISSLCLASPKSFFRPPRCVAASAAAAPPAVCSSVTLYDVLGIAAGASGREIKAAYRRLALECHPDVAAVERRGASAVEFMRVHAAYETLSDPEKRADYDRSVVTAVDAGRRWAPFRSQWTSSYSSGLRRRPRTWETDQCW
ncbi:hypothetical protein C4D60_Mb01t21420 [Musa balbisiana]|uniref:J domain-containing protein n=1 Tax=Musa balbisiana TaxID=52838 RepID=A0A4S8JPT3_MUSBA|nr:hypothetical protein C4D60_Mb01t21420 [Musa balbisiana]